MNNETGTDMDDIFKTTDDFDQVGGQSPDGSEGITINLTGDDLRAAEGFKPIPVGTWLHVAIFEASLAYSKSEKNAGKPMYKLVFKLMGESAKEHGERKIRENAFLWSGALFNTMRILKALGYDTPNPQNPADQFTFPAPHELQGRELKARVSKHEPGFNDSEMLFEKLGGFKPLDDDTVSDSTADIFGGGGTFQ